MSIIKVKEWIRFNKLNESWTMLCLMSPSATYENKIDTARQIRDSIHFGEDITKVEIAINNKVKVYTKLKLPIDESRMQDEFKLI